MPTSGMWRGGSAIRDRPPLNVTTGGKTYPLPGEVTVTKSIGDPDGSPGINEAIAVAVETGPSAKTMVRTTGEATGVESEVTRRPMNSSTDGGTGTEDMRPATV